MALLGLGCAAGWRPRPAGALAPDMPRRALCCVKGVRPWGFVGTWAPTATAVWGVKLMMAAVPAGKADRYSGGGAA